MLLFASSVAFFTCFLTFFLIQNRSLLLCIVLFKSSNFACCVRLQSLQPLVQRGCRLDGRALDFVKHLHGCIFGAYGRKGDGSNNKEKAPARRHLLSLPC